MAIDATDAITPAFVQERLEGIDNADIKNAKVSQADIVKILSSLKGVMLGITFGREAYGKLKVDFGQDVTPLADIAKPLLLDVLSRRGAMLNEFAQWKTQTKGTTIFFDGPLTESGLTRITSLINLPTQALQAPAASSGPAQAPPPAGGATPAQSPSDPQQLVLETTQNYYKSIDHLMADLKGRKGEAHSIGQIGLWFGSYANRVTKLPILNVDEQMLEYGQYVAQQLRDANMAIKGFGINKRVAEVNADNSAAPFGGVVGQSVSNYYANGSYGRPVGACRGVRLGEPPRRRRSRLRRR